MQFKVLISNQIIKIVCFQVLLLLAGSAMIFNQVLAQQTLVLNQANTTGEYHAAKSIILQAPFSTTGSFRAYILNAPNCETLVGTPSSDQNYISTRVFKEPGVDNNNINNSRTSCKVNQTIQYFDGLGRPLQTVITQGSPNGKDMVQPFVYDAYGRETFRYLLYADQGPVNGSYRANGISSQQAFYNSPTPGIVPIPYPYSETRFESSPLNRVEQQGFSGAVWQPYNGGIPNSGHTIKNVYSTNISGEVQLWTITATGAYVNGSYALGTLYKTTLRDENWTSDKSGTTDEFKDLEGRVVLKRVWENESTGLSTYYVYDDLGNLTYVIPPAVTATSFTEALTDAQFNQFVYGYRYDRRKRVIRKKIPGKGWEEYIYNPLNQIVFSQDSVQKIKNERSFFKYDALGRTVMQGYEVGHTLSREAIQTMVNGQNSLWESRDINGHEGYTNNTYPQNVQTMRSQIIYYYDDYNFPYASSVSPSGITASIKTIGLPTGTKTYLTDGSASYLSANYYDEEGRVLQTVAQNYLNGTDRTNNSWNFAGELIASTRTHIHPSNGTTTVATRYEYDHVGRKLNSYESINGQTEVLLSSNIYNEIGQLQEKQLHNGQQTTSYAYNERGWLKSSTSPQFSQSLNYQDGSTPQYNGNIANQNWGAGSSLTNTFTYQYDKLNRLTSASSLGLGESISYDVMGNITSLSRDNYGTNNYTSYTGNRLNSIGGFTNGSYDYDGNGNLKTDGPRGLTITYNHLNLPALIGGSQNISYTYDASGRKLKKQSATQGTTNYVDGIQYKNDGTIDFIQTETGIAQNNGGTYTYHYNLTDHLGNVRYTFDVYNGSIRHLQSDDYYAFGLRKSAKPGTNNYLYNGKELQEELGRYDYGARFYDPVIGRWNVIDPKGEKPHNLPLSPYNYCNNNPILYIDKNGEDWFVNNKTGEVFYIKGQGSFTQRYADRIGYGGDVRQFERLGADNMFGDKLAYGGEKNILNNEFKMFEGGGAADFFMKKQGYAKGERIQIKEVEHEITSYDDGTFSGRTVKTPFSKMQIGDGEITFAKTEDLNKQKDIKIKNFKDDNVIYKEKEYSTIKPYGSKIEGDKLDSNQTLNGVLQLIGNIIDSFRR